MNNAIYKQTHLFFKIDLNWNMDMKSSPVLNFLKEHLGDTNPYTLLQTRDWFTVPDGIWIKHELLNTPEMTCFILKNCDAR
jgi:hypothetical protein